MGSARERLLKEGKEQIRLVKEADVIVLYGKTVLELLARVMLAAFDAKSPIITFDKKYYADTTIPDSYRNVCVIFCGIRHSTREDMKKSALHIFGGRFSVSISFQCIMCILMNAVNAAATWIYLQRQSLQPAMMMY